MSQIKTVFLLVVIALNAKAATLNLDNKKITVCPWYGHKYIAATFYLDGKQLVQEKKVADPAIDQNNINGKTIYRDVLAARSASALEKLSVFKKLEFKGMPDSGLVFTVPTEQYDNDPLSNEISIYHIGGETDEYVAFTGKTLLTSWFCSRHSL